eukprot:TRINITY_DN2053_c1_g1_i1.p2 TRINITY_DN2053_c1_g1~~TRINITY_DN2053_c1_g1_i1.p2  ORF type:complete len:194 (-),score=8.24 TRINITY_DN2053_c1_g1_i1:54-635(-)
MNAARNNYLIYDVQRQSISVLILNVALAYQRLLNVVLMCVVQALDLVVVRQKNFYSIPWNIVVRINLLDLTHVVLLSLAQCMIRNRQFALHKSMGTLHVDLEGWAYVTFTQTVAFQEAVVANQDLTVKVKGTILLSSVSRHVCDHYSLFIVLQQQGKTRLEKQNQLMKFGFEDVVTTFRKIFFGSEQKLQYLC